MAMTFTVIGYAIAAAILVGGFVLAGRRGGRQRMLIFVAAGVAALVIGWFAWLVGTSA
jgi:hypothetical protein